MGVESWSGFAFGYAVTGFVQNKVLNEAWWRRWESNPRPRNFDRRFLRVQPAISSRLGVPRQSLIKMLIARHFDKAS